MQGEGLQDLPIKDVLMLGNVLSYPRLKIRETSNFNGKRKKHNANTI
jgi:hypothetical protein